MSTISRLSQETALFLSTVTAALGRLGETGLVTELTGRRRNRVFSYPHYLEILAEGTGILFEKGWSRLFPTPRIFFPGNAEPQLGSFRNAVLGQGPIMDADLGL